MKEDRLAERREMPWKNIAKRLVFGHPGQISAQDLLGGKFSYLCSAALKNQKRSDATSGSPGLKIGFSPGFLFRCTAFRAAGKTGSGAGCGRCGRAAGVAERTGGAEGRNLPAEAGEAERPGRTMHRDVVFDAEL